MSTEAMRKALEAMLQFTQQEICLVAHHTKKDQHHIDKECPVAARYTAAINSLRTALAEAQSAEPVAWMVTRLRRKDDEESGRVRYVHLDEQAAAQDLEGWRDVDGSKPTLTPLYTHPPQQSATNERAALRELLAIYDDNAYAAPIDVANKRGTSKREKTAWEAARAALEGKP